MTPWTQQAPTSVSVADHLHTFTDLDLLDYPSDPLPELSHLKPVNAPNPIPYLAPSPLPISPSAGLACDIASLYNAVHSQGIPNFCGARIPVSHQLNIPTWRHYADRFDDPDLIDFLEFGFPLSYVLSAMPWLAQTNHASATRHPTHIDHYVATELGYGTLQGPFDHPPFAPFFQTSPLMTAPKKNSEKRWVILDISFPPDASVNYGIPHDFYLNEPYKLRLPGAQDLRPLIIQQGPGCLL